MAPRVEAPETNTEHIDCFLVDLQSPDPFDIALFEKLARRVDYRSYMETSMLKYFVISGRMWIFSEGQMHFSLYDKLKRRGESGKLQSAGAITVDHYSPGLQSGAVPRRRIYNWSPTLILELSRAASDEYKFTEIAEKLGEFFIIE